MRKSIDGIALEMDYVEGKTLYTVGYVEEKQMLAIEFTRGPVHTYDGVPKSVYEELLKAQSVDDYFTENIRPIYKYRRVW